MKHCVVLIFCLGASMTSFSQLRDTLLSLKDRASFVHAVEKKFSKLDSKLHSSTAKLLDKISREEYRIYKTIRKKDTAAATKFLTASQQKLNALKRKLNEADPADSAIALKQYIPAFDTIKTSLAFLLKLSPGNNNTPSGATDAVRRLEVRLQVANEIKKELNERSRKLMSDLQGFSLANELKAHSKTAYYYQQQLNEFKSLLKDRRKAEQKAIAILAKNEGFKNFIRENGMLAKMFGLPNGAPAPQGMQTRQAIAALILQRFAGTGGNPQDQLRQQIGSAQQTLDAFKKKLNAAKQDNSTDTYVPQGFSPNTQKKKSIFSRMEYGLSFQTQKLNSYFPATTDIAVSLGYKLNDKSTIGIGAAYKMGLGKDWDDIQLTHEGVGLRSFIDLKLKGGLWLTGGYEQNHFNRFRTIQQPGLIDRWNQSAFIGLTRKVSVGKKKTGKVQLLYDFFYDKNKINAQPIVFRIGYNF